MSVTNWSTIRRVTGPTGTYCFGSTRVLEDKEWAKRFYAEALAFGFTVRVEGGVVYLDAR